MSVSDYFRKHGQILVAPTLQIYASNHCTKNCEGCTTSSPHRRAHFGDASAFVRYINLLYRNNVRFRNINITGGEPFANKNLEQFIRSLRSGIDYYVRLLITSNGFWIDDADRFPSGLAESDGVMISRYRDIIFKCGGLARYEALINRLNATRPESYQTTESYLFKEWAFTNVPRADFSGECGLAVNLTVSDTGLLYRCCVAPGAPFNPKVTPEFRERHDQLHINLDGGIDQEQIHRWILAPLPSACRFCSSHNNMKYYPVRDVGATYRVIDFADGNNREVLNSGFSLSDSKGVWTEGDAARMHIPPLDMSASAPNGIRLVFRLQSSLNSRMPRVDISIGCPDSDWKDRWEFEMSSSKSFNEQGNYRSLFIPKAILGEKQPFRLDFKITALHSQFEAGQSSHQRAPGVLFQHIIADVY